MDAGNNLKSLRLRENFAAPPGDGGEKTWSEVSGGIDGIAGVEAHRQADDQNHKSHSEGLQSLGDGVVVWIHNSQNAHDQRRCADDLCWRDKKMEKITVSWTPELYHL